MDSHEALVEALVPTLISPCPGTDTAAKTQSVCEALRTALCMLARQVPCPAPRLPEATFGDTGRPVDPVGFGSAPAIGLHAHRLARFMAPIAAPD